MVGALAQLIFYLVVQLPKVDNRKIITTIIELDEQEDPVMSMGQSTVEDPFPDIK